MNDRFFSLCFVILAISNVGSAFAEDAEKKIRWDTKVEPAREVQKDQSLEAERVSVERENHQAKKEMKRLEREKKKQEKEKDRMHRDKIKKKEKFERDAKKIAKKEQKKREREEKELEKQVIKEQNKKSCTSKKIKDASCKDSAKKQQKKHKYADKLKHKKEKKERKKKIDHAYAKEHKKIKAKQIGLQQKKKELKKSLKKQQEDRWEKEERAQRKAKKNQERALKQQKKSATLLALENALEERREERRWEQAQRKELIQKWSVAHAKEVEQDYQDGRYADLYKLPAWPSWSQYFNEKHNVALRSYYSRADDAYDACGANSDVSILHFGQQDVALQDVLLVSKLTRDGVDYNKQDTINGRSTLKHYDKPSALDAQPIYEYKAGTKIDDTNFSSEYQSEQSRYLSYLAREAIELRGRVEQYGCDVTMARSFWDNAFVAGFVVPVLYKKHRLEAHMNVASPEAKARIHGLALEGALYNKNDDDDEVPSFIEDANYITPVPNTFQRRYGGDTDLFVQDLIKAKGFERLGGSVAGFGDVSLFMHYAISSLLFDRAVVGARVKLPTGKEAATDRLWAPGLGTGLTELSLFGSIALTHSKYCNPHGFIEGSFGLLGHVERRVPHRITVSDERATALSTSLKTLNIDFPDLAFAERVITRESKGFSAFDSSVAGFADYVTKVRMAKGFQLDMRIGNIIEECFSRRGFLDIHYSLMLKRKDRISQPDLEEWDAETLWRDTQRMGHTLGADYTYQCDAVTRASCGAWYTLAGKWVPKEFGIHFSLNHSF